MKTRVGLSVPSARQGDCGAADTLNCNRGARRTATYTLTEESNTMPQPQERNIEETRQALAAWLAGKMPSAGDIEIKSLGGPEATGFSSDTLMFDFAWSEDGKRREEAVVVRLEPSGYQVFPEYDITLQYKCMDVLRGVGVPAPRMFWLEEDSGPLGKPFYVMERLEGQIPPDRPPYHMDGWMLDISEADRRKIWMTGLDAMAKVHNCDWEKLGFGFLDQPRYGKTGLDQQLNFYKEFLAWAMDGEPHPICERAIAWLEEKRPADEPTRLCWGDARIGNMIFRDYECIAVIDWEMATLGNPVQDLAWYIYLDRHHGEGIGVERLAGLPDRKETIARWESQTGLSAPADLVEYYEIFAGLRFAVIMVRVANQMKYYEQLPEDSDFHVNNTATGFLERIMP
jgi:aminoglycoside phosphotransferase (APT) family kinase protein